MSLIEELYAIEGMKFSFGKANERQQEFCQQIDAKSMFIVNGWGLSIPVDMASEMKLRMVFYTINQNAGTFIFNITGVDLKAAKDGFENFDEAYDKNMITEWELNQIIGNTDFLDRTIFHNGAVRFSQNNTLMSLIWNY